jgi:glycosyltransferase 2 family protein
MKSNRKRKSSWQNWIRGMLGLGIGAFFLWLSFRQTSLAQVGAVLANTQWGWLAAAIVLYGANMMARTLRWHALLRNVKFLPLGSVGMALLIGYAANNILPARLGEIVRANFTGKRYNLSRTAIAGSILVERVLDGLVVVLCLAIGRLFVADHPLLSLLTIVGTSLFVGIFVTLWLLSKGVKLKWLNRLPAKITSRMHSFTQGVGLGSKSGFGQAVTLSLLVWLLEGFTLWSILKAVGVSLNWHQMLSMIGVTSLSTLLPSAPGFVGTYQYSYTFTLKLFGYPSAQAIAAATAFQIFLFGGVTLVGAGLFTYLSVLKPKVNYQS